MDFNKTIAALEELQEYCKSVDVCWDCQFCVDGVCVFEEAIPQSWLLPAARKEGDEDDM